MLMLNPGGSGTLLLTRKWLTAKESPEWEQADEIYYTDFILIIAKKNGYQF